MHNGCSDKKQQQLLALTNETYMNAILARKTATAYLRRPMEVKEMVKIRLKRMGAKKAPFYRIVVADAHVARDGIAIAEIGYYDPTKQPAEIKVDVEAAKKWLSNGAQPTDTVKSLLKKAGAI